MTADWLRSGKDKRKKKVVPGGVHKRTAATMEAAGSGAACIRGEGDGGVLNLDLFCC